MKLKFLYRLLFLWLMLPLAAAGCSPQEEKNTNYDRMIAGKGEIKMASSYFTHFADCRRSSFQNVKVQCKGEILWSADHSAEAVSPQAVYLFGSKIVLIFRNGFSLYSENGELLWFQGMNNDSPIGLTDTMIFYHDEHYRLSAVNADHKQVIENGYFPGPINSDYPVWLIWTGKKDCLYVIQFTGGAEELPPKVMVKRTVYNNRLAEWTLEIEGSMVLPPLYLPELEQAVVFTDQVYFVNTSDGQEISRQEIPLDNAVLASAGSDGTVYLAGTSENRPAVVALKSNGDPEWEWISEESGVSIATRQPPITSPTSSGPAR